MKNSLISISKLIRSPNNPVRAAYVFGFASLSSWMPLFNVWLEDAGLDGIRIGTIAAIPWAVMLILQPLWGIVADRYGKLLCLKISAFAALLLFAAMPLTGGSILQIAILTFLISVFNTPILPLLDSLALDYVDASSGGISYSNIRFWGAPGYGLGALVTGWLIPVLGIHVAFFSASAFLVLFLLAARKLISGQGNHKSMDISFKDLNHVITGRSLLLFLLVIFIVSIGQSAITFFLTLYMRQIGASPEITGTAISIQAFGELPWYFIAGWLLLRTRPERVVLIAIFGTALRLFFYSINSIPNVVLLIEPMNGITWTLLWIASVEYVNEIVPVVWRTTGQSLLWAAYFGAGSIAGSIISGRLYQDMDMHRVYSIISLAILCTAVLASFIFLFRKRKISPEHVQDS